MSGGIKIEALTIILLMATGGIWGYISRPFIEEWYEKWRKGK